VHDGETAGGYPIAREDLSNVSISELEGLGFAKDDLSNVSSDNVLTNNLAKADLSNVSADMISGKGIAKTDLSNVEQSDLETAFAFAAKGYLHGFTIKMSSADSSHDIQIDAGSCRDEDDTCFMKLTSAFTKQIDANWAEGDNEGGFPQSISLAVNTWYHMFVIFNPATGAIDAGFDTDINASNLLSAASAFGYTKYRRIGSVKTDSSYSIVPFLQRGDYFYHAPVKEIALYSGWPTSATSLTLTSVPVGVRTQPILRATLSGVSASDGYVNIRFFDNEDAIDAYLVAIQMSPSVGRMDIGHNIGAYTDTSQRIKWSVGGGVTVGEVAVRVQGYVDRRGKE
jgi:hypothetical protein